MVAVAPKTPLSPFAAAYSAYLALGFHPIGLIPATKEIKTSKWTRWCDVPPTGKELASFACTPNSNIGIALGSPVSDGTNVICTDVDLRDNGEVEQLKSALPASPMGRFGSKGIGRLYRAPPTIRSARYQRIVGHHEDGSPIFETIVEILAHGKQVVVPPSIHPDTGREYIWIEGAPVNVRDLPLFDEDALTRLEEAAEVLGWRPGVNAVSNRSTASGERREAANEDIAGISAYAEHCRFTNSVAFDRLDNWVPALDLYNLKPKAGGYRAVATWRGSQSGRPLEERGLKLSIDFRGIVDYGTGVGYTPLDLVMARRECNLNDALDFLWDKTGLRAELDAFCQLDIPKMLERQEARQAAKRREQHVTEAPDGTLQDASTREVIPPSPALPTPTNDNVSSRALVISATPFVLRDPSILPRRQWVLGKFCCRKEVSTTIAPGGVGKTALSHTEAVALASGRNLLGFDVPEPRKVWVWNGEEPVEEMERRIGAICLHHGVSADELSGRLFVDTADDLELVLCEEVRGSGAVVRIPVMDALVEELKSREIDVMIVDPFISTHNCTENDNNSMQKAATAWKKVAQRANCAIHLVHHTRKSNGQTITSDSSRGGDALVSKSRAVRPLNPLSERDAKRIGVSSAERRSLFWYDPAGSKVNLTAATGSREWYRLVSVPLWNQSVGVLDPGDEIGVVTRWEAPAAVANLNIDADALFAFKAEVRDGFFMCSPQAHNNPGWVGHVIARHFDLDTSDERWKPKAKTIWRQLLDEGEVIESQERDSAHQVRKVGRPAPDGDVDDHG